ncbi:MAG: (Fe-S)-binding protein [Deltaproteobacteria bacterium]|nr:(Fe-S)-binding protein [Deltaproteobacteria bacterium]
MVTARVAPEVVRRWRAGLARCIRCGTCRSVCPVLEATGDESGAARGKMRLVEAVVRGELDLTRGMQERFSRCLLCKACTAACPSGVPTDALIVSARTALARENALALARRVAFTGLRYRRVFEAGLRLGALFQRAVFRPAPDGPGRLPRIPLPSAGLHARRLVPELARRPLRALLRELAPLPHPRARVAFFPGCMLTWVYPEAGLAVVRLLRANGIEPVVPEEIGCCGVPAATSGDAATGALLAAANVAALSAGSFDAVVTACGSCGAALAHDYGETLADPAARERWRALSAKVRDVTSFLAEVGLTAPLGPVPERVTYHDPCHLARGMGVTREPRALLRQVPGLTLAEMKEPARCCGAGGTFSLSHYELSRRIGDRKLDDVAGTGAALVVTGCSACRMHMADGIRQRGEALRVVHTAEVLARSVDAAAGREARHG